MNAKIRETKLTHSKPRGRYAVWLRNTVTLIGYVECVENAPFGTYQEWRFRALDGNWGFCKRRSEAVDQLLEIHKKSEI